MTDLARQYAQLIEAFNRMDWSRAVALAGPLVHAAPEHPLVRFVAGIALLEIGRPEAALPQLEAAAQLDPTRLDFASHHARALLATGHVAQARDVARAATAIQARDPASLDVLGQVLVQVGDYGGALTAFSHAADLAPGQPQLHLNRASALIGLGRFDEAERALEQCLAIAPRYWRAHYSLAQLRRQTSDHSHLARLRALLPEAGSDPAALTCLHLALAKEHEDLGDYAQAMTHLVAGKQAARPPRGYDPARDAAMVDALIAAFVPLPAPAADAATDGPIFIVGMPRSGTTLVDRIVSSHPAVRSAGELHTFGHALARALRSPTPHLLDPAVFAGVPEIDWPALGRAYLAHARTVVGEDCDRFTDKLPHNFLHLGAIARALPTARIVCLRRQPMDTCLSNFRQLFAASAPYFDYSYALEDVGRYYVQFDRLMAHWTHTLPGRVLSIDYEELVDQQEAVTRRLLTFCGLPWDEACLHFERNAAPVTTPSAVQVRSTLHRDSLERWKRYGPAMDGLRAILVEAGIAI
jgi:tetratricopeptide (TPR) repeat protein